MKHWIRIVCIGLLLMITFGTVGASEEDAKLKTLGQAVEAAQALYLEGIQAMEKEAKAKEEAEAKAKAEEENPPEESPVETPVEATSDLEANEGETVPEEGFVEEGLSEDAKAVVIPEVALEDRYKTELNQVALEVAILVIDLDFAHKKETYLANRQEELKEQLAKAEAEFKMGKIRADIREEMIKESIQLDFDLNLTKLQIENTLKTFIKLTSKGIAEDFQFSAAYLIADGGKLSLPPTVDQEPKGEEIRKKYTDVLSSFGELGEKVAEYIKAGEQVLQVEQDFKMGKAKGELLAAARAEKERAWIEAFEKKASYSKGLYELDCLLEGYIAKEIKKTSQPIFR